MFCIHCGKEIGEKAAFCPYCGKPTSNHVSAADNYEYKEIDNEVRHKLMFSLVWHDKGSFTITRFQNTGSELLDMINIDTPYVNAKYYGVSD